MPQIDENAIPHRDLGQLIGRTFDLYGKNFWKFVIIGLPPQILGLLLLFVFPDASVGYSYEIGAEVTKAEFDEITAAAPAAMLIGLLTFVAFVMVEGATIHAVAKRYLNQKIDISESLRRGFSKSWIMIISSILAAIALGLSGMLIVILVGVPLVIFLIISWAFVYPVIMIEGAGPVSALAGSYNLVKRNRLRVLGVGIVFILIQIGLQVSINIGEAIINSVSEPLAAVASGIALAFIAPLMFIGLTVFYFDIRSRKEGMTLDTLAMELGGGIAGSAKPNDLRDM